MGKLTTTYVYSGNYLCLTKQGKKLDSNYTRMLRAILNNSWRQHLAKQLLYGHQPPITKTIQVRRIRHAGHCWRSRDELISDILMWSPPHRQAKAGRPARAYVQRPCADTYRERWTVEKVAIEGQGDPCWWHDMMMMIYIQYIITIIRSWQYHGVPWISLSLSLSLWQFSS